MGQTASSTSSTPSAPPLPPTLQKTVLSIRDADTAYWGQDLTLSLPDECIALIFHKLSTADRHSCSLVCKRWHVVDAFSRDRLALHAEAGVEADLPSILSRFEFLTCLTLRCERKAKSVDNRSLVVIGKHCGHLSRLKLKRCKAITDDGLAAFANLCGHSLRKFSCGSSGISSNGIIPLLENCPRLEDLSIKRLRKPADELQPVMPGISQLRRLCLKEITCSDVFVPLILGCRSLHTLVLARNRDLRDSFFTSICKNLSELVELHIDFLMISGIAMSAIASCAKLEVFHVSRVRECSDEGFSAIANGCRSLRKLHVDDRSIRPIGDKGLLALGKYCMRLQELVLIGVSVTKSSLDVIVSNCTMVQRMALCRTEAVGDAELACIAEKCTALKELCIKNCPISDEGIEELIRGCPSLTKVKVKRCRDVTTRSALLFQLSRPSVTASLDTPSEVSPEEEDLIDSSENEAPGTTASGNKANIGKSRLLLVAGIFLRKFSKTSHNQSSTV